MATEDEAREAADGEEVQVKAVDLGTTHLQMNLDRKLPSHGEMKDEATAMDSTEGIKVTEDRVLEKASSVVETPAADTPNGTHSSLNGHMKEGKILNEEPQENGQEDNGQLVASPDGTSTDQSNTSNGEEAIDSSVHVEKTAQDTSLLKQDQPEPKERHQPDVEGDAMEDKMVQEDTLQTDNDVEPKIDAQQGQNLEPAEVTEDTRHASMSCIPRDEVIAEAPAGVQTSLEPSVDDSDALPVTSDGNTETEPAKVGQESFPEDEHTNEAIKLEDQPRQQTDDVDAGMVREEVPKSEDVTKSGQADESSNGDQEELNQESPEETSDPVHEKIEETSHDSNVSASETTPEHEATTREPALDVQEVQQDQGLAEEISDAKEVDTEKTVQQSGFAFEEATPEDNVAIIEPSSDIQHPNNVESEEINTLEDAKSEEISDQSNVAIAEDATQDKKAEGVQPVQGLEEEEPKSTETVEMDEASNQPQTDVTNNLAEEDSVTACQPQVIELKEEVKDTEVSDGQEICHKRTVSASKEDCVEDDVTAEGPACDSQEVDNVASVEEIKDNTAENINQLSSVATVEPQTLEAEPAEEMKDSEATEPRVISQRSMSVPEDVTAKEAASDIKEVQTEGLVEEPNGVKTEEISNQSSVTIVGETAQENKLLSSGPTNDAHERELELQENGNNEDVQAEESSHQTHTEEILTEHEPQKATEDNTAILTDVSIQQLQEQEPVKFRDAEATEPQGICPSYNASTSEQSTPEDNETTEPNPATQAENSESAIVTEESKDVKSTDEIVEEETLEEHVQESEAPVDIPPVEDPELEETKNTEPVEVHDNVMTNDLTAEEVKDTEAIEVAEIHNESTAANICDLTEDAKSSVALEDEAASDEHEKTTEATFAIPQPQEPELEEIKNSETVEVEDDIIARGLPAEEIEDTEAMETEMIPHESTGVNISELINDVKSNAALADETAPDEHAKATEATAAIPQLQESELEEIKNSEPAEVEGNISESDLPAEKVKDTEAVETESINESTDANNSELTANVPSNVAITDEAAHDEHVTVAETTVDIPEAQEQKLEEIKNTEPVEVEENRSASNLPAEEVKETEAINKSSDANINELTEDVKNNVALVGDTAPEEHVIATEATVVIPRAQEPEQEIKNTEPVEVEGNISANDLPAEEMKDTAAAMETEGINESTDTNNRQLTEDVKNSVAFADEAAPEEHVTVADDTVDIPQAQEPEVEGIKNTEPVEMEENISERDLPAEEVKDTEAINESTDAINESTDANISELTGDVKSNVALADEAAPEEYVIATEATVDIPQAEDPELEEIKNTEPVEVEENISASDLLTEEVKDTEPKETEAINESTDANISELTEDVKSNVTLADEAAPEEHVTAAEATVDIPQAQVPEVEELKNVEPVEVEENRLAGDLPAEEVKETGTINESTGANISELTEDVTSNVTSADEAAPEEHVTATEATVDIPRTQEPELEEIENTEPVEVEENASASDLPAEEVKDTEAKETESIIESTDENISELTEDMKSNVALTDAAAHEEPVTVAKRTVDIPQAQEPELEEIKNTEAGDLPAKEVKETEAINKSTDANISELNEDVKSNVALADEEAHEENVTVAQDTVDIPQAQVPELEEIKNTEHIEMEENRSVSDLQAEEVKETEANISELTEDVTSNVAPADEAAPEEHVTATEATIDIPRAQEPELEEIKNIEPVEVEENTSAINESTDANISELTEDVKGNVAHADEAAPEEHVIAAEATVDMPQAQVPELEELENAEPVEVEEKRSASDLPAEEVKDTENMETEAANESIDENISELTEDVALADEEAPDVHLDIPPAQEPAPEEINNAEPVEAEDSITADNGPAEEIIYTKAMETEEIPRESTDHSLTASAPLPDNQQVPEQEAVEDKTCTDTTENQGEPQQSSVSTSAEHTPTEDKTTVVEHTQDTHVQSASSELGSDPNLLVPSAHQSELAEDSESQLVKAEETDQSNDATLEEPTAEDNAANEIDQLADSKQEHGLESVEENKCTDASEGEEASHASQDPGLEEPVSESDIATVEPTSDIQQVNDMDEEEIMATEAINDEEISCQKTEVATLEDPSPTDNGTAPKQNPVQLDEEILGNEINNAILADEKFKDEIQEPIQQKDESSDLGEKTAFTTQKDESATEEDVVHISGEDTVETSNNIEQIKDQSKSVTEHDAIKSGDHTNDQDDEQLHNVEAQMQVCERSVDVLTMEQPDEDVQKVNLDQQQEENEAIDEQTEEIQRDEQKHDDSRADFTTETILDPQSNEIETTNREEDADVSEDGNDLASPIKKDLQKTSDLAPSNEEMVENDPTVVPQNVESRVHTEEKECINKANDDMQAIQASEEEIVDEVEKKPEMQNEGTNVNHDKIRTKPEDEVASEQLSNNSTDTKMDDTMSPSTEMIHGRIDAQPIEIEEVEENKGFGSISEYAVEKSKQSDVEQDLSIHPKVVDDKLATEQNGAEVETDSNEEMVTGYTAVTESVKLDEVIYDKASGADGALSDENLETIEDNRRNLEASPAVTASGESTNEDNEHHKLALPAHSTVDGDETEQASGLEVTERGLLFPEKPLPTESEEQEESQITKEQDEENVHEQETGDTEKEEKEAEQSDLPVSHCLMNLIMGKESNEPYGNSESEAEKKQEETTKDDSSLITSQQEESLVPIPTENKVDNKLIFEQGKHNLEGSEETHDIRLEKDEELSRNTHDLEAPVCQNNVQGETSSELVPAGPGLMTEMETRDVKLDEKATNSVCQEHVEVTTQTEEGSLNSNLDDIKSPKASQVDTLEEGRRDLQHEPLPENTGSDAVSGQTLLPTEPNMGDEKNFPNDTDDLQSPLSTKREESNESSIIGAESTIEDKLENGVDKEEENQHTTTTCGATEEQIENVHDNLQKGTEAISDEQKGEITEPVMGNEINLFREKEISAGSECKEETQSYKFSNSELDNSEKPSEIQSDGSNLHIDQDKQDESAGGQILMEKNNLLDKPEEPNLQEQETDVAQKSPKESYGGDQNCLAIRDPVVKEVNVNKTVGSHVQTVNTQSHAEQDTFNSQVQERDLDMASPEAPEAEEKFVESKREFSTDEEQSPKKDNTNMAGEETFDEKRKDVEEAKSSTDEGSTKTEEQGAVQKASHDQKRDLDVVSPTEAPGMEEKFVDTKSAEFSTDEEPSPKKDGSNMAEERSYHKKTNGNEEAKNFTDEAPIQIEEREAGQKASPKKHNILSGVGSKVKHQLAKVKKAIIGKPGHTKSESPKA